MSTTFAFHLLWDFHLPILEPIYNKLKSEYACLLTKDVQDVINAKPKILILADGHYDLFRAELPETLIVYTRHGFSHKNFFKRNILGADFACVSSPYVLDDLAKNSIFPKFETWITGFPAMDLVFREQINPSDYQEVTLLYAPTYNKELNNCELIGKQGLIEILDLIPNLKIIIKPHPVIPDRFPEWVKWWKSNAAENNRISLIEDSHQSVFKLFNQVDLLLTDISSVMFYFLALNKPIISLRNKNLPTDDACYDSQGPEHSWKGFYQECNSLDDLKQLLVKIVQNQSDGLELERLKYQTMVFGDFLDSNASERIAQNLKRIVTTNYGSYLRSSLTISRQTSEIFKLRDEINNLNHLRTSLETAFKTKEREYQEQINILKIKEYEYQEQTNIYQKQLNDILNSLPIKFSQKMNYFPKIKNLFKQILTWILR